MTIGFSVNDADTCCIRMDLYKKGVFAQPPTQEDGPDIMSCFFHGLENMTCTELKSKKRHNKHKGQGAETEAERKSACGVERGKLTASACMVER